MTISMLKAHTILCDKYAFTKEQIAEQQQFIQNLNKGNVDIAFEGSKLEAMSFLTGLSTLCGR